MLSAEPFASDAALVAGLRAGDTHAFEALLRMYSGRLLRLARRFLASEEDARDALQDAMVSVFKSIGSFESGSRLSTWLHRIVVNACLMKLRTRRRRHEEIDLDEVLPRFQEDGHQVEPSVPWTESAESMLERAELRELVRASIEKLPETYRIVLHLRDIEELSTEETADILGIKIPYTEDEINRACYQAAEALSDSDPPTLRATKQFSDLDQELAVLLQSPESFERRAGEALDALGDRCAIYGFSGMTRTKCDYYRIKGFEDAYAETVKSRISGIVPKDYTRMGPPLRHSVRILRSVEARTKLLITLSDGKPEDVYPLKRLANEYVEFENPSKKGFPTRIIYRMASDGALIPRNEGDGPSIEIRFQRVKCPGEGKVK